MDTVFKTQKQRDAITKYFQLVIIAHEFQMKLAMIFNSESFYKKQNNVIYEMHKIGLDEVNKDNPDWIKVEDLVKEIESELKI